jgi:AcrR family transcriptional regulator
VTTTATRDRGVSAGLTSAAVLAAATAVAERDGLMKMSLRSVAAELGVSATAIYHHVAGKDELVDAVGDAFVARLLEAPLAEDPAKRVRELAHRLRQAGIDQPGLLSALVGHVPVRVPSGQIRYAEEVLRALMEAGAPEATAVLLYNMIVRLCVGDVVAETNLHAPSPVPLPERLRAHAEQDAFPHVARMSAGTAMSQDRLFDQQLDVVLASLHQSTVGESAHLARINNQLAASHSPGG